MALIQYLTNPYNSWTRDHGTAVVIDSYVQVQTSDYNLNEFHDHCRKAFTLDRPANNSQLWIQTYREVGKSDGLGNTRVILTKPDTSTVTLYNGFGEFSGEVMNGADIKAHLTQPGTYSLELYFYGYSGTYYGEIRRTTLIFSTLNLMVDIDVPGALTGLYANPAGLTSISTGWNSSVPSNTYTVYYRKVGDVPWSSVSAGTSNTKTITGLTSGFSYEITVTASNLSGEGPTCPSVTQRTNQAFAPLVITESTWGIQERMNMPGKITFVEEAWSIQEDVIACGIETILEELVLVESFMAHTPIRYALNIAENLNIQEQFQTQFFMPLTQKQPKLLVFEASKDTHNFGAGQPLSTFDTDDIDFGMPGFDKTLCEIQALTEAQGAFVVQLYCSTNSGISWSLISAATLEAGQTAVWFPWITAEKFRLRFRAYGLDLSRYKVEAIYRGPSVPGLASKAIGGV